MDVEGFELEMERQRQRSKDSAKSVDLQVGGVLAGLGSRLEATRFCGHGDDLEATATVVALLRGGDSVPSVSPGTV